MNPIKGIEVIHLSNREVSLNAIDRNDISNPVTNESILLIIGDKDFKFERTKSGTYKTTIELF